VELSVNGGATWTLLAAAAPSAGPSAGSLAWWSANRTLRARAFA
jgi:hypothetical protein